MIAIMVLHPRREIMSNVSHSAASAAMPIETQEMTVSANGAI